MSAPRKTATDKAADKAAVPEAYAYTDPDAQVIGAGASGDLPGYLQCPVCLAHGGGGHGSNCPNAGQDPADWEQLPPDGWASPDGR
jgi:hypothetical protein